MGRRHNQRERISLPIRIFGTDADGNDFTRLAQTTDISANGARIAGVYLPLKPGGIVGIQHGVESAPFRVVWTGKRGSSNAGQIGLAAMQPEKNIWNRDLPSNAHDDYEPTAALAERRRHFRFDCDLGVELQLAPDRPPTRMRCTDISRGGCYLETWSPLPTGTSVNLFIALPKGSVRAAGEVRTTDPAFGMGIRFTDIESTRAFDELIQELHVRLNPSQPTAPDPLPADPGTQRRRVLLAEDSRFLRSAYALFLRREGYHVITADDGDQALNLALTERPDAIVLDLLMPRLGGVGALKLLKEDPSTALIPVIVLSGLPSSNEAKLLSSGAFAYLAKTQVGPEDLPSHVHRAIESSVRPLPRKSAMFSGPVVAPETARHASS